VFEVPSKNDRRQVAAGEMKRGGKMRATFTVHALRLSVILGLVGCLASATSAQAPAAESGASAVAKKVSKAAPASAPQAQPATEAKASAKAQGSATKSERPGGPQEGIKVHGHWVIEVRNPDGSFVSRKEFENALVARTLLATVLGRQASVGLWAIQLSGSPQPCLVSGSANSVMCVIAESNDPGTTLGPISSKTLTLRAHPPGLGARFDLQLNGTVTVGLSTSITLVETIAQICASSVAPATSCPGTNDGLEVFTSTSLASPVNVISGQIVQVTVTFSFS
jgi:hypothetical protein